MPIYEYRCPDCRTRPSIFWRSFESIVENPACPNCGGRHLTRLISRTAQVLSEDSRMDALADSAELSGVDENDPKSVARWARSMGKQFGDEEMGEDFDQAIDEMESGADNGQTEGVDEEEDSDL